MAELVAKGVEWECRACGARARLALPIITDSHTGAMVYTKPIVCCAACDRPMRTNHVKNMVQSAIASPDGRPAGPRIEVPEDVH